MTKTLSRDKARILRSRGASLNELALRFRIPKSTIRYWCRDIVLSDEQQRHLFQKQKLGGIFAAERIRQKRIQITQRLRSEGMDEIGRMSSRELLLVGAALYWAEGYRKGDGEFGFVNSDPEMIRLVIRWLTDACEISKKDIHLRVCINIAHKGRLARIHEFWSQTTGVPRGQFSSPTLIKVVSKKRYLNNDVYFGTLRIKVRRSTNLRRKVMGWIAGLASNGE
ncbi:MAG: hypothetical protein WAP52_00320 [Candidatus Sungiibacteriota bacterium]